MEAKIAVLSLALKEIKAVLELDREVFKEGNEGKLKMIKLIVENVS